MTVYANNESAISLYRNFGYTDEGLRKKARKIDGRYQDEILMARFTGSSPAGS